MSIEENDEEGVPTGVYTFCAVYCDEYGAVSEEEMEVTNYMPINVNFFGDVEPVEEEE